MQRKRSLLASFGLFVGVGTIAIPSPAFAVEYCNNRQVTISITSAGSYNGTNGNDVVRISSPSGMTDYNPIGGRDHICADTAGGPITVWAAGAGHWIGGTPHDDVIYGSDGPDDIGTGFGNDMIRGNGGDDVLWGYSGNDFIRGNGGDDSINGGVGNDCLVGGDGYNEIYGDENNDVILLGHDNRYTSTQCAPEDSDNSSAATAFVNNVFGGGGIAGDKSGNDRIWGTNGNDFIQAGAGNDSVRGFGGNDSIEGNTGTDNLNGGAGDDLMFESYTDNVADKVYGGTGTDTFGVRSGGGDVCYAEWGPGGTLPCSQLPSAKG